VNDGQIPFLERREPPGAYSSARSLLKHVGTWVGDDLERCLQEAYSLRGKIVLKYVVSCTKTHPVGKGLGSDQLLSVRTNLNSEQPLLDDEDFR